MNPAEAPTNDASIDEDAELLALEALLSEPDEFVSKQNDFTSKPLNKPTVEDRQKLDEHTKQDESKQQPSTSRTAISRGECSFAKALSTEKEHSAKLNGNDTSIDEDEEIMALEALLSEPDEFMSKRNDLTSKPNKPTDREQLDESIKQNDDSKQQSGIRNKPTLRQDSTFEDAFSYEVDISVETRAAVNEPDEVDSSDDEDIKNFLERKYNEYGSDINKRLKQQRTEKQESRMAREVEQALKEPIAAPSIKHDQPPVKNPHQPKMRQALLSSSFLKTVSPQARSDEVKATTNAPFTSQPQLPTFTDPVFGLRIINPLISSTLLVERMSGRKSVPLSYMATHIDRGDLSKDWVFAGALVSKSPTQTTKKGKPYSIWKISDLRGEIKMVSLFLFGSAYKDLWKTAQGMCIGVLNPTVFEKRAKSDEVACLSIDTSQKVLILGQSKDLGICKAKKRNGENCTSVVNLSECDYCIFHMKQEYGKLSRRSELQSTSGGINELRNKVLGKSEVFYGGQSYTAIPAKKSFKLTAKDNQRISALSEYAVSPFASSVNHVSKSKVLNKPVPYAKSEGPVSKVASAVETNAKQRLKDMERLSILMAENERHTNKKDEEPTCSTQQTSSNTPDKLKNREFSSLARTPKLSNENFCIEVNIGEKRAQQAKQKAAQLLKQKPLEKRNPNSIRGTNSGKRRAIDELNEKFTSHEFKRQRLEDEQHEYERKSRIQRIIDATSSHTNLIDLREQQEHEKYFSKLEKKEALEEKMLNTYKLPCKAVICQRCKYTAFSAAERCKEEKHPLKVIDAEKRFYKCKDCGNRTATVFKIPKTSCKNCQSSRWERAAMIRDRKLCIGENLSVRGDEETFLGSLAANANLNLLVSEE